MFDSKGKALVTKCDAKIYEACIRRRALDMQQYGSRQECCACGDPFSSFIGFFDGENRSRRLVLVLVMPALVVVVVQRQWRSTIAFYSPVYRGFKVLALTFLGGILLPCCSGLFRGVGVILVVSGWRLQGVRAGAGDPP